MPTKAQLTEELQTLERVNQILWGTLDDVWQDLNEVEEDERSPRLYRIHELIGSVIEPELFEDEDITPTHSTTTMIIPENLHHQLPEGHMRIYPGFEVEIDDLMAPVIQELWNKGLLTWFCCSGVAFEEGFQDTQRGYISCPSTTDAKSVIQVLEEFGFKNIKRDLPRTETSDKWALRFDALREEVTQ